MIQVGDLVEWRDQEYYPGLRGIVTHMQQPEYPHSPEIFVHWNHPNIGPDWEQEASVRLVSAITKDIK